MDELSYCNGDSWEFSTPFEALIPINIEEVKFRVMLRGGVMESGSCVPTEPTTQLAVYTNYLDLFFHRTANINTPWTQFIHARFEPKKDERFYIKYDDSVFIRGVRATLNLIRNLGVPPMQQPAITNVSTYQSLLQARVLTGVLRIVDHHLVNHLSTNYIFRKLVTRGNTKAELQQLQALVKAEGYLLEARSYTDEDKTGSYIAYLVKSDLVESAIKIDISEKAIEFKAFDVDGRETPSMRILDFLRTFEVEDPIKINYVCGFSNEGQPDIDVREVDPNLNRPLDIFYPYIKEGVSALAKGFAESTNNLLLLVGPPGTGKTSILREFTRHYKDKEIFQFCGDKVILHSAFDSYLAKLPPNSVIIIEDADSIIGHRKDGNHTMSMLLNEIDGITTKGNKFIITTNLESLQAVDSGLLRPGRCYATKEFRLLTADESRAVVESMGLPEERIGDKKSLSVVLGGDGDHVKIVRAGFSLN